MKTAAIAASGLSLPIDVGSVRARSVARPLWIARSAADVSSDGV
jgi:hypothetical protein